MLSDTHNMSEHTFVILSFKFLYFFCNNSHTETKTNYFEPVFGYLPVPQVPDVVRKTIKNKWKVETEFYFF